MIRDVLNNTTPWHIEVGDCLEVLRKLPDRCVQCCVTSPPYWGLRDYGVDGQLGLEPTPEQYVARMVEVFAEVRRVLRDDGTLWLNIGDSYFGSWGNYGGQNRGNGTQREIVNGSQAENPAYDGLEGFRPPTAGKHETIKPKDLVGIPWSLAFALRADGWYLRSEIIWHKKAPMPESVTDRPTKAHEQMFLLAKSQRYFYDAVASAESAVKGAAGSTFTNGKTGINGMGRVGHGDRADDSENRNMRSVWTLGPESYSGAHFATMPTELARRCLLAGTSENGCCSRCGTPWKRQTAKERKATRPGTGSKVNRASDDAASPYNGHSGMIVGNRDPNRHCTITTTTGWEPGCDCRRECDPEIHNGPLMVPYDRARCIVLDPFNGAGTTGLVARQLGCRYIGLELNPEYADMARARITNRGGVPGVRPLPGQLELFGESA